MFKVICYGLLFVGALYLNFRHMIGKFQRFDSQGFLPPAEFPSERTWEFAEHCKFIRLNEAEVSLYFFRDRVRRVFTGRSKKLKLRLTGTDRYAARVQMSDLDPSSFDSVEAVLEVTKLEAIEYIKAVLKEDPPKVAGDRSKLPLTPVDTSVVVSTDAPASVSQLQPKVTGQKKVEKAIFGKLVGFGRAMYPHTHEGEEPSESFYVKLVGPRSGKESIVWGIDLERAVASANVVVGQFVNVIKYGRTPVLVISTGADGKPREKEVLKNLFEVVGA